MLQASSGRRGLLPVALCVATMLAAACALAGTGTDPDQSTFVPGTSLVGQGNVQVELGVAQAKDGDGTSYMRAWTTPMLLRIGTPSTYEFRVQTNAYKRLRTYSAVESGMGDLTLGFKAAVPQNMNQNMSIAFVGQAAVPSGSETLNNHGFRPEVQLIGKLQMPNSNSLGAIAGLKYDMDQNDTRYKSATLAGNASHTWNAKWASYVEGGIEPWTNASRGGKNLMVNVGSSWCPMPASQLNATVGFGLKDNDTNLAWTVGYSRRFSPSAIKTYGHKQDKDDSSKTPSASSEDGK